MHKQVRGIEKKSSSRVIKCFLDLINQLNWTLTLKVSLAFIKLLKKTSVAKIFYFNN